MSGSGRSLVRSVCSVLLGCRIFFEHFKEVFFSPLPRSFWKKLATTAPETLCQSAPTADGKAVDVLKIEGDGAEAVLAEAGFAVLAPEEVYCVDPA